MTKHTDRNEELSANRGSQRPPSSDGRTSREPRASRRRFLQATAATGVAVGFSGTGSAQEAEQIELGGESNGWVGVAPEDIEDEENPTLTLEEGESYEVVWENLDGVGHNFVIIDDDGEQLVESETVSEEGETKTVEFEAEEEVAEYYCEPHPQSMRARCTSSPTGSASPKATPASSSRSSSREKARRSSDPRRSRTKTTRRSIRET